MVGTWREIKATFLAWRASRRQVAELEHEIGLCRERVAHLEEIVGAYGDTLETYHRETQVRTAVALTEREALRRVEGGRA